MYITSWVKTAPATQCKMGSGDKAMSRKRSRPRGWRQACHGRFKLSNFDLLEEVQLETIFVFD